LHGSEQLKKTQYLFFEILPGSAGLFFTAQTGFLNQKLFLLLTLSEKKPPELSKHLRVLNSNSKSTLL
jgi:hypothetical protein